MKKAEVSLDALVMWVEPPWIMTQEAGLEWTQLDLVVKRNGKEFQRLDLQEICEDTLPLTETESGFFGGSQSVSVVPEYVSDNAKEVCMLLERFQPLEFELPGLEEGDRIEFELEGALSNGYKFAKTVQSYVYGQQDGFREN